MSTRNDGKGPSVGRAACRALRRHALPLAGIFLAHAALRALALAPEDARLRENLSFYERAAEKR